MATVVDSYSEANFGTWEYKQYPSFNVNISQSFTADGSNLDYVQFYIRRLGSPVGNITALIKAHSGTFGTSSVPTGAALATSDVVDSAAVSTSYSLVTFTFSGYNKIYLTPGVKYCVILTAPGSGDTNNCITVGADNTSPTHAGNLSWGSVAGNPQSGEDFCFYVYGNPAKSPLEVVARKV